MTEYTKPMNSKSSFVSIACGFALFALAGCQSGPDTSLNQFFDPDTTFSNYKSFGILEQESPHAAPDGMQFDPGAKASDTATRELKAKGYVAVDRVEDADIALVIHGQWFPKAKLYNTSFTADYGTMGNIMYTYFDSSYGTGTMGVENYNDGAIAVEIYDVKLKKLVWLGFVTAKGVDQDTMSKDVRIGAAVTAILSGYPAPGTEPKHGTPAKSAEQKAAEEGLVPK